jgi:uncharacterized protein (TIGR02147 family)
MLIEQMKKTFADRCRRNPAYSLRAFSRSLGMDSSTVSAIMNGKRPLTIKSAKKIVSGLEILNPVEAQNLIADTLVHEKDPVLTGYEQFSLEAAEAISFWQHFAILAVLEMKDFKATDRQISERLNIPLGIVWECLDRLSKLNLIVKNEKGWKLTGKNMATPSDIPSAILREGHRQTIIKALDSLENDPVEVRDMSGITMSISKDRLPQAKKMIQTFRRKLSTYMEEGSRDAVYRLNIQLFPLSQEKTK